MLKRMLLGGLLVALCLFSVSCGRKEPEKVEVEKKVLKLGFLLETYDVDRWQRDEEFFIKEAKSAGASVLRAVADADQDKQNKQAETFLTQGADVLVVIPKNLNTAGRIIKSAHEKNVPVLAYDRLIMNCDLDMYITFDNEKVGYLEAKGALAKVPEGNYILLGGAATDNNSKLLRAGQLKAIKEYEESSGKKINIIADPYLNEWDREEARRRISNLLTKFNAEGTKVDAIVCSNDSTAGGAIAALMAEGLAGKVAVSGQDAELAACQRVMEGLQAVTVYKPVRNLAETSAKVAIMLAGGEKPEEIAQKLGYQIHYLDNGKKEVPSIFLEPVYVTRENMVDTVIKDGWHSMEKVFANIPRDQWPE